MEMAIQAVIRMTRTSDTINLPFRRRSNQDLRTLELLTPQSTTLLLTKVVIAPSLQISRLADPSTATSAHQQGLQLNMDSSHSRKNGRTRARTDGTP